MKFFFIFCVDFVNENDWSNRENIDTDLGILDFSGIPNFN